MKEIKGLQNDYEKTDMTYEEYQRELSKLLLKQEQLRKIGVSVKSALNDISNDIRWLSGTTVVASGSTSRVSSSHQSVAPSSTRVSSASSSRVPSSRLVASIEIPTHRSPTPSSGSDSSSGSD